MTRIRLYCDEDTMDADLVRALRVRGVNVTTALDQGMIRQHDSDHLEHSSSQERALYSFNVGDYNKLHTDYLSQGKRHSGIIVARQQIYSVGEQMRRLLRIVAQISGEEMKDSILFLSDW